MIEAFLEELARPGAKVSLRALMRRVRNRAIDHALAVTGGNQARAARKLGIGRSSLVRYLGERKQQST